MYFLPLLTLMELGDFRLIPANHILKPINKVITSQEMPSVIQWWRKLFPMCRVRQWQLHVFPSGTVQWKGCFKRKISMKRKLRHRQRETANWSGAIQTKGTLKVSRYQLLCNQRNSSETEETVFSFLYSFCIMEKHWFLSKVIFSLTVTISVRSKEHS